MSPLIVLLTEGDTEIDGATVETVVTNKEKAKKKQVKEERINKENDTTIAISDWDKS
ncbi:conserved hypothetical protein [Ricinus communis]|uniref:Uncharacterized protein n=1 Tax=Ricinus communis TaxID=3988 RepID=B9S457_RICCO|nr:conserved hypothetical protein [Ricinus communis]